MNSPFNEQKFKSLLEGLGIVEAKLSMALAKKDFRVDGDFWVKEPNQNPKLKYDLIANCLISAQYGISIEMNEEGIGYPIYRMNEIHNMICDFDVSKSAQLDELDLKVFKLNDRDVLFNRTNSYEWVGRTGLFRKTSERNFVFASYLVRFVPNPTIILPEYLTAFLSSKIGVWDVKRRSRQSVNQTNVNPEEVKQIGIPLLEMKLQLSIKDCFDKATSKLQQANTVYAEAESILLKELALINWAPAESSSNVKTLKESFLSSGRIDAEYYQPKYDSIESLIKGYPGGYGLVKELCHLYTKHSSSRYS